jgi:hypothetical protein
MSLTHRRDCQSPRGINDPKHLRDRAGEMRMLAGCMKDARTRRKMERLADGWDKLADHAERRVARPDRSVTPTRTADSNPKRSLH